MLVFRKTDLYYSDYSWKTTEGDNAKVTGFPDDKLLNRKEGYEIIYFINRFIEEQYSWKNETDTSKRELGVKIEKLIHDNLPGNTRSHQKVKEWIIENWNTRF